MEKPTEIRCRVCNKGPLLWGFQPGEVELIICNECLEKAGVIRKPVPYPNHPKANFPLSEKKTREEHLGIRHDNGKLDWSLVPFQHLEGMVRVLEFGKAKYAAHNWRKGLAWSRVTNSLQRHLNAFNAGEAIDLESGLPHTAHILCNALFLAGMEAEHPELDDRYAVSNGTIVKSKEHEQKKEDQSA